MANEPPYAEPHVGWCGEGERKTRPYPISIFKMLLMLDKLLPPFFILVLFYGITDSHRIFFL